MSSMREYFVSIILQISITGVGGLPSEISCSRSFHPDLPSIGSLGFISEPPCVDGKNICVRIDDTIQPGKVKFLRGGVQGEIEYSQFLPPKYTYPEPAKAWCYLKHLD
jgi:hypothetical protein